MQEIAKTAYDEIPYPAGPYAQSHPDRLATLAMLFGMSPPDIRHCRVLELGCADGSNLIPMACALPASTFIGVDLSVRQIDAGRETIAALGLTNIQLRRLDIREIDENSGAFDYVIAHGIYSWVPVDVQEKILGICSEHLVSNGVAYVSYNTHPGWRMRGMLRDMMLYHSRKFDDPKKQIEQARALIQWLGEFVRSENNPYGLLLKSELEQMQHWQDSYFRHDSLAEINDPVYFHEFVEQAERHGLQYLGEAEFPTMLASNYASAIDETLNRLGRDIIEMEQYMDFLRNRMFRQTLLCHAEVRLNRSLGPWSLDDLFCAASLRPEKAPSDFASLQVETFRGPKELIVSTDSPIVKAALACLAEQWPQSLSFIELVTRARLLLEGSGGAVLQKSNDAEADAREIGGALMTCFSKGSCELHLRPGSYVISPGERPCACPLVRLLASRGKSAVTNRRHERVILDSFAMHLLPLLDGEHDQNSVVEALAGLVADGSLVVSSDGNPIRDVEEVTKILASELARELHQLAYQAVLTA